MNKREKTKELIISKTKELLVENANITIKDIADACFINIAAVNYHFGSKENLLSIVINDIVDDLKRGIFSEVNKMQFNTTTKESLAKMLEIIYQFTVENTGVIRYLFLNSDHQQSSTNILVQSFFTDNEFTRLVLNLIMESLNITDENIAYAKYMLLFSSFSIPLFIEITKSTSDKKRIPSIESDDFREIYISQVLNILN